MRNVRNALIGATTVAAMAAPAALAASHFTSTQFWQNHSHSVVCGKRTPGQGFQLLCSAKGIPRPKGGGKTGDPFVVLTRTGKAQRVLLSQNEFPSGSPKTLSNGTQWERSNIKCSVGNTVTCTNQVGHGFTIGNGKYKSF